MGNPVVHFEIMGKGSPKLRTFYQDAFGWQIGEPVGPNDYALVQTGIGGGVGGGIGGGIGEAPEGYTGHVTFYVEVPDVARAFETIEKHGGSKMMGPDQVPGGPIIGLFKDPGGHVIGLVHSERN